ncbi:malate synthase A [Sorangium sp. So ce1024]|uniref:malate synthase A n=1 Tax=unclassified Sorangium TaxID=2621164 RepID=UPI003F04681D
MSQNHDLNLRLLAPRVAGDESVLTPEALRFLASLGRKFADRVPGLLARRREVQARLDAGERFDFLPGTREVREGDWTVAPLPADLLDRRVEITGPVDPKMIINALNSGASMFMADFEDATSPTWKNLIEGQAALRLAARRELRHEDPTTGKRYALNDKLATLLVRPRGWHLYEKHVELDGKPLPGGLFDFGLFFFHNARELVRRGTGPYFYLPKMESHLEARLWNDVFLFAQDALGLPAGTIKATVLIETLPAAFEMDEILYELRQHSAGLNCGRWDYIFSFIKKLRNDPACVMPDRSLVTMEQHFLRSYTQLLVKTCHRRGVHAMGGMAAQIPIKSDPEANRAALEKVRADKLREVKDGHDGTWVAHPGLVPLAREVFDAHMSGPNQIERKREDVRVTAADLLKVPSGARTEAGLRHNIRVGIQYIEAWISGLGCVPLYNLMEDAATAEISRTQVWQWIRHQATLDDGKPLTVERFRAAVDGEMSALRAALGEARFDGGRFAQARELFERLSVGDTFEEFLTLPAYELLITRAEEQRS